MSAPAFTPGPWAWRELGAQVMLVTRHQGSRVVLCDGGFRAGLQTRDANGTLRSITPDHPNAHLIAAAPELYEALKAARLLMQDVAGWPISDPTKGAFGALVSMTDAALEKAEGRA